MTESSILYETVIKNGYCIGCGVCSSLDNSPFKMEMDKFGNIVANAKEKELDKSDAKVLAICPFSEKSKNEDVLGDIYFPNNSLIDNKLGKFIVCFAGFVVEGKYREQGSSGGIGKWLGYTLLNENEVDYFIQVVLAKVKNADESLFNYKVFDKCEDVINGSKSAYYPTSLVNIIHFIKSHEGSYAITGVPCFIKSIRLLTNEYPELKKKIKYTIGIICGGMKSANQSKIIGMQLGVHPNDIVSIDFRRKNSNKSASNKTYQVWSKADNIERCEEEGHLFGTDWGMGFFKPQACEFCDDIVAETADISLGDAWLPKYTSDPKGTNILIVRNVRILEFLERFRSKNLIFLEPISKDDVIRSQAGGFRHRREALSLRIANKEAQNKWYPPKRITSKDFIISESRQKIYNLRERIAIISHNAALKAINSNNLDSFINEMTPFVQEYIDLNNGKLYVRIYRKIKLFIKYILRF